MIILFITHHTEDKQLIEDLQTADPCWNPGAANLQFEVCDDLPPAWRLLEQNSYHAIVLDLSLAKHSLMKVLMRIGSLANQAPIILIANPEDPLSVEEWRESGVQDILPRSGLSTELFSRVLRDIDRQQHLHRELREHQKQIQHREAILHAISQEAERFLKTARWIPCIPDFLKSLGEVTGASRVYIFHNELEAGTPWVTSQKFEWVAENVAPQINNPHLQNVDLEKAFPRWKVEFENNRMIQGEVSTFPESEREWLKRQNINSIVVVPIFPAEICWGFIGFNYYGADHSWTPLDVPILRLAASILSSAIKRRHDEQTIQDNAATLRTLLNAVTETLILVDKNGKILAINDTGAARIEKPVETLLGTILYDAFPEEVVQRRSRMMNKMFETGQPYSEIDERKGIIYQNLFYPVFNKAGDLNQIAIFAQDVTERVHAEEALTRLNQDLERLVAERTGKLEREITIREEIEESLQENERRFRNIVQDQTEMVCRFLPDGTLTFVNTAYCQFFQKTEDQLINNRFWDLIPPDTWRVVRRRLDSLTPEKPVGINEHRIVTPDGKEHWIGWTNRAYFNELLEVTEFQSTGQNLTERKHSELELRRYTSRLETIERVGSRLRLVDDPQQAMEILLTECASAVQAKAGGINLFQSGEISRVMALDGDKVRRENTRFSRNEPFIKTFENGQPQIVFLKNIDPAYPVYQSLFDNESIMLYLLPLQESQSPLGLLYLGFKQPRIFSPDESYLLTTLAELGGITLKRIQAGEQLKKHMANRERELEVLYHISALSNELLDLSSMLKNSLKLVLEATSSQVGAIHLLDEEEDWQTQLLTVPQDIPEALFNGLSRIDLAEEFTDEEDQAPVGHKPVRKGFQRTLRKLGYTLWQAPVRSKGKPLGLISLFKENSQPFTAEENAFLNAVSNQLGIVVESSRLRGMLEQMAVNEERQRLARELHDSVVQSLYGLLLFNRTAQESLKFGNVQSLPDLLEKSARMGTQAIQEMRLMLYELRPLLLEQEGLISALQLRLETVERRFTIDARLEVVGQPRRLPVKVETEVYRIAIESLNNTMRHANCSEIIVQLIFSQDQLQCIIQDNGKGFDPQKQSAGGMGLLNIGERAKQINANLQVLSTPGAGTRVKMVVPLDMDKEE